MQVVFASVVTLALVATLAGAEVTNKLSCSSNVADIPKEWASMVDPCVEKMKAQVQAELTAAMTYMAMGAYFARDNVNRMGFAHLFFESASEEREHAIKIIDYLLMRGELKDELGMLIQGPKPLGTEWDDAVSALQDALRLEASVTNKIRDIIAVCEDAKDVNGTSFNDYHLVDYLTGDFLEEQYAGQRVLAGHISTLGKMRESHGIVGEFLYDKRLQS